MAIKRIRAKNFKSFKELDLELGDLNILIGANASGKSNFVQIFKFLRDIRSHGLENAISIQGGAEYLTNVNIGASEVFSLEITSEPGVGSKVAVHRDIDIRTDEVIYEFAIQFDEQEGNFEVLKDKLTQKSTIFVGKKGKEKTQEGELILSNVGGEIERDIKLDSQGDTPDIFNGISSSILRLSEDIKMLPNTILLEQPLISVFTSFQFIPMLRSEVEFVDISVYDFDPNLARTLAPIAGEVRLAENGSNLAIAIKNIIKGEDGKRKLLNLVKYLLDFVDDLDVERRAIDRAFLLKLREKFSEEFLPVLSISDGTINMLALIIALYFDKKPLTIIEEPDRGIHPYLISRVVHMMEDASQNKQVIVTTHNPEMVKHADKKDLLLISRDKEGFSCISRPSEKKKVKIFLENEIGFEDLYVDNLLEV